MSWVWIHSTASKTLLISLQNRRWHCSQSGETGAYVSSVSWYNGVCWEKACFVALSSCTSCALFCCICRLVALSVLICPSVCLCIVFVARLVGCVVCSCLGWLVVCLFSVLSWLIGCVVCSWVGWLVPTVELPTAVDFTGEPALIRQRTADFLFFSTLCFSFQCFSSFVFVWFCSFIVFSPLREEISLKCQNAVFCSNKLVLVSSRNYNFAM